MEKLITLESQLLAMQGQLEALSESALNAKDQQLKNDAKHQVMQERFDYVNAVQQLSSNVERFRAQIDQMDATRAATTLGDVLVALKTNLMRIYTTAKTHSTLVSPLGRSMHKTWDSFMTAKVKSPMKRDSAATKHEALGMRLLLTPEAIRSTLSLLETVSKHCSRITHDWLENTDNMTLVSNIASEVAINLRAPTSAPSSRSSAPRASPLFPAIASMDLQFAQHLFWLCRTCQELKILLVGPPQVAGATSAPASPSPFASPLSSISNLSSSSKLMQSHIASYGPASLLFEKYWHQMEPLIMDRLSKLKVPDVRQQRQIDMYLREVHDIVGRVWVATKLLWYDTPNIVNRLAADGVRTLDAYLDLHRLPLEDPSLQVDLPVSIPHLAVFALPHMQLEQLSLRWAGIIDSSLQPLYDAYATQDSFPSLDDAMTCLSQLSLYWGNAASGPWYALAQAGLSPTILILRFLPAVKCLRQATNACVRVIEMASDNDKLAYLDMAVWSQKEDATLAWCRFLVTCLCMLICSPGALPVEDFLTDSFVTPLSKASPDTTREVYAQLLQILEAPESVEVDSASFWTHEAIVSILGTLKLGTIKTVLRLKLQDLINPKPAIPST